MELMTAVFVFLDAHPYLYVFVVWPLVSLILNAFLHFQPQEEHWIEKHPRLAGLLAVLQAGGVDPWGLARGLLSTLRGHPPRLLPRAAPEKKP